MVSNGNRSTSDYMISISESDSDEKSVSSRMMQVTGSGSGVVVHLTNQETDAGIEAPLTHRKGVHFHTSPERGQENYSGERGDGIVDVIFEEAADKDKHRIRNGRKRRGESG